MEHVAEAVISPARTCRESRTHTGAVYVDGRLNPSSARAQTLRWKAVDSAEQPVSQDEIEVRHALYCGHYFLHFGHFLIETLPALWWATGNQRRLIFHPWSAKIPKLAPFARMCLEALSIGEDRIIFATRWLSVDDLLLPPRGNPMGGFPIAESLRVYRAVVDGVNRNWPDSGARRLYVSRRFIGKNQRAPAEHLIEREFARRGFRVLFPEQLSFAEQVSLVSRAEVLAGLRGSALHLSGFLPAGGRMIEVTGRDKRPLGSLAAINDALGIGSGHAAVISPAATQASTVAADIEALSAILDEDYPVALNVF